MEKRPTSDMNKQQDAHAAANLIFNNDNGNINPLDQELILKLVLSHVGEFEKYDNDDEPDDASETEDLKNCRLVNHMWNRVAIKVLEEKMFAAMQLDSKERVKQYKSLLWKTRCSTRSTNNTELHHRLASVQISVGVKTFDEIKEIAQLLVRNSHLRVCAINFNFPSDKVPRYPPSLTPISSPSLNQDLFTLFQRSSPTVKGISCDVSGQAARRSKEFDFDACYSELEFPKLSRIHYNNIKFFENETMMVDFTRHMASILKHAPKLAQLRLTLCHEEEDTEVAQAAALQLRLLLQTCAPTLKEFTLHGCNHEEFNRTMLKTGLAEVIFPKLEFLQLKYVAHFLKNGLSEFLLNNCPCLVGTTVTWGSGCSIYGHDQEADVRVRISDQSSTKLSFYPELCYALFPRFLDHVHQMLLVVAKVYSSTTTMKIYLELIFILAEHLRQRLEQEDQQPPNQPLPLLLATHYPVLGNITTLKVQFNSNQESTLMNLITANWSELATQLYHHILPNVKILVIKPYWLGSYYSATTKKKFCKNRILRAIRFLCNHPGIENLEIKNFASNSWLQQIGAAADGLKSLKLQLEARKSKARPPRVKLMTILSQFPSLEFLQFEEKIVSRDEIEVVRAAMSTVNKFDN